MEEVAIGPGLGLRVALVFVMVNQNRLTSGYCITFKNHTPFRLFQELKAFCNEAIFVSHA